MIFTLTCGRQNQTIPPTKLCFYMLLAKGTKITLEVNIYASARFLSPAAVAAAAAASSFALCPFAYLK
jgi:hypothetical protein